MSNMARPPKFHKAPTLTTDRLVLRAHKLEDFEAVAAMFQEVGFTRYTTGQALPRDEAWTKMIRHGGHWSMLGHGYWAIEEKATGKFIGEVGLADFKRVLKPSMDGMLEAGWGLITSAQGQGFASEALKTALIWGDKYFPGKKSVCMISPENTASIRLAEKHGFLPWTETTYKGFETILLRRE